MVAILTAILKKVHEDVHQVERLLWKKIASKKVNLLLIVCHLSYGGHIGCYFEKKCIRMLAKSSAYCRTKIV